MVAKKAAAKKTAKKADPRAGKVTLAEPLAILRGGLACYTREEIIKGLDAMEAK